MSRERYGIEPEVNAAGVTTGYWQIVDRLAIDPATGSARVLYAMFPTRRDARRVADKFNQEVSK